MWQLELSASVVIFRSVKVRWKRLSVGITLSLSFCAALWSHTGGPEVLEGLDGKLPRRICKPYFRQMSMQCLAHGSYQHTVFLRSPADLSDVYDDLAAPSEGVVLDASDEEHPVSPDDSTSDPPLPRLHRDGHAPRASPLPPPPPALPRRRHRRRRSPPRARAGVVIRELRRVRRAGAPTWTMER